MWKRKMGKGGEGNSMSTRRLLVGLQSELWLIADILGFIIISSQNVIRAATRLQVV